MYSIFAMDNQRGFKETIERLYESYGPVIPQKQLAVLVDSSPESLANIFRRTRSRKLKLLYSKRVQFGRRVHYPTIIVAAFLVMSDEEFVHYITDDSSANVGKSRKMHRHKQEIVTTD